MPTLIDASLWIDFTRAHSPRTIKYFVAPYILHPDAHLAEPITFEILRHATAAEAKQLTQQFQRLRMLARPPLLWAQATELGQECRRKNITVGSLDLLIATIALHHGAEVVTFDGDYQRIASVSKLQVKLLQRPTP
ncbi:MAG TPA: VapC toxin family PIN domain ribonuclease [Planctomycetales bacterium]|jgi:predicted nucleic acid-binding protein|nr:VapC toxin family PIN domain ribonuclease [Planctomycetales bacterium]